MLFLLLFFFFFCFFFFWFLWVVGICPCKHRTVTLSATRILRNQNNQQHKHPQMVALTWFGGTPSPVPCNCFRCVSISFEMFALSFCFDTTCDRIWPAVFSWLVFIGNHQPLSSIWHYFPIITERESLPTIIISPSWIMTNPSLATTNHYWPLSTKPFLDYPASFTYTISIFNLYWLPPWTIINQPLTNH